MTSEPMEVNAVTVRCEGGPMDGHAFPVHPDVRRMRCATDAGREGYDYYRREGERMIWEGKHSA